MYNGKLMWGCTHRAPASQYTVDRRVRSERVSEEALSMLLEEENSSTMGCHIIKFMKCYSFRSLSHSLEWWWHF